MAIRSTFTTGEVLTAADLTDTIKGAFINTETTTARTLGTADAGNLVTLDNNSGGTVTIPTNTTWGSPLGTLVHLINIGTAGSFTVGTAAGVTLNAASATMAIQEGGTLIKTATNTWQFVKQSAPPADPGLAFITGTTFTTSSAVNVNNCFTSTYRHYRLGLWLTAVSADLDIFMRLRAAGSDNTSTSYRSQRLLQFSTNVSGLQDPLSSGNTQFGFLGTLESSVPTAHMAMADIMSPQATAWTTYMLWSNVYAPDLNSYNAIFGGAFRATTSFDGFSLITSTGTISGSLVVYGYRNS